MVGARFSPTFSAKNQRKIPCFEKNALEFRMYIFFLSLLYNYFCNFTVWHAMNFWNFPHYFPIRSPKDLKNENRLLWKLSITPHCRGQLVFCDLSLKFIPPINIWKICINLRLFSKPSGSKNGLCQIESRVRDRFA